MSNVTFSYTGANGVELSHVTIPVERGDLVAVSGHPAQLLDIVSAIVGDCIPLNVPDSLSGIQAQFRELQGDLTIHNDDRPGPVGYMGNHPGHHLFYSRVYAEVLQDACSERANVIATRFGLCELDGDREIATLSGGEKMRLALFGLLRQECDLFVLNGVVPWLDKDGMNGLIDQIESIKHSHRAVVVFGNEFGGLLEATDQAVQLTGDEVERVGIRELRTEIDNTVRRSARLFSKNGGSGEVILALSDRTIEGGVPSVGGAGSFELSIPSLRIERGRSYLLVGRNGSGKTTLARALANRTGLDSNDLVARPSSRCLSRNQVGLVRQEPRRQVLEATVGDEIENMTPMSDLQTAIRELLPSGSVRTAFLSSYELKLLVLLRAATEKLELLILDEPTWGLSLVEQRTFVEQVRKVWRGTNCALITISHLPVLRNAFGGTLLRCLDGELIVEDCGRIKKGGT